MNYTNFIRECVERLGMDADGALIGAIGAIVATIGRVNGVNWKKAGAIIIGGLTISGYLVPALREKTELESGTIFFAVFMLGVVSQHIYKSLDTIVPALLKTAGEWVKDWIEKKIK